MGGVRHAGSLMATAAPLAEKALCRLVVWSVVEGFSWAGAWREIVAASHLVVTVARGPGGFPSVTEVARVEVVRGGWALPMALTLLPRPINLLGLG